MDLKELKPRKALNKAFLKVKPNRPEIEGFKTNLVKQFKDFEDGRLAEIKTDFFYKQIAEPYIDSITSDIEFTYFNIQDFQKPFRNADKVDDNWLIALFKLLSPEHLLKLPFNNDSNSLDKRFYK
jgi:adenine-specific DNA-methyltransferase